MLKILTILLGMAFSLTSVPVAFAEPENAEAAWAKLRNGEAVLMLRHALAPGFSDPAGFKLDDCSTQRNLNNEGRAQARAWNAFLAKKGITSARVFSSQWCRCMETAEGMALGAVTPMPSLNSFFENRSRGPQQTRQTIENVNALPEGQAIVLVSHQVNVSALAGIYPSSNEGVILELPLTDSPTVLARVQP